MSFVVSSECGIADVNKMKIAICAKNINLNNEMMKMEEKTKKLLEKCQKLVCQASLAQ